MRMKRIGHDSKVGCVLQTHRRDHFPQDRSAFNQKLINYESAWNLNGRAFDGVDDYVNAGNAANLHNTGKITIELWMNPYVYIPAGQTYAEPLRKENDYVASFSGSVLTVGFRNSLDENFIFNIPQSYFPLNQYTHLVFNLDGIKVRAYVNGILYDSVAWSGTPKDSINNLYIGVYGPSLGRYFNGTIDEVHICNYAQYLMKITTGYFRRKQHIGA